MAETSRPANRLAHETSPYLLQHAHNPVDWYPWGEEALERARREDRLILLSIGYSACHWCHVMERESFENASIAALMNEHFVNIKVDREERPDLDDIYMAATVTLNRGQGGWPMTVFLTPQLEPVFAGTYFPPDDIPGRPGFRRLLTEVSRAWREDRDGMADKAIQLVELLRRQRAIGPGLNVGLTELRRAGEQYAEEFDEHFGGFGSAPKFPPAVALMLLLRVHRRFRDDHALTMVRTTLDAMARGGMYDHIGGGFARYSTDRFWLVPHFEKMLYDNALLVRAYLEAHQVTNEPSYRRIAVETLDYVLRDMTAPDGGFYSSTDADSEGVEGKFFVWRPEEIEALLGPDDARVFNAYYDITPEGNWEGNSIPRTPRPVADVARQFDLDPDALAARLDDLRARVYAERERRVRPGLDDKILTAWNGLMISACAEGYRVLGDPRYLKAATAAARFVLDVHRGERGHLVRTSRNGAAHLTAVLEDYAYLADGLVDLYEAGGDRTFLDAAVSTVEIMIAEFADEAQGAFFNTGVSHEQLVMRFREGTDGATPSANAVAASVLARLALHLDRAAWRDMAARAIKAYGSLIVRYPRGFAKSLCVTDFLLDDPVELAFAGNPEDVAALRRDAARVFLPNRIEAVTVAGADDLPLLRGKVPVAGRPTLYVCRGYACEAPVTDPDDVERRLRMTAAPQSRDTIAVRRPGYATAEGTARFRSRFAGDGYAPFAEGVVVSRVGFGGYRVDDETPGHREALHRALASGVNLVDTSTNYMDGGSERLIGSVLGELIAGGELRRDEVVVVSKIGYVQGATYEMALARERREEPYPEMVKLGDGLWHCIHPVFLEDQLERSLDRLELETLDVCLLHNPEYFLSYPADPSGSLDEVRAEFYRRLEVAFTFLENEVNRGRIRWYGVSSNTVAAPPRLNHATSLAGMVDAALRAGGERHHFRVLQLPLNLFESNATLSPSDDPERRPVLDVARELRMAVLANRPLNAFVEREMVRLADFVAGDGAIEAESELRRFHEIESRFVAELAPDIQVPEGALEPARYFQWHGELDFLVTQEISLEQWSQMDHQIRSGVGRVVSALDRNLHGPLADRWRAWRDAYLQSLHLLLSEFRRRAIAHAARRSAAVRSAIDPVFPESVQPESLSRKSLWTVASTPGVTSVLSGMRTTAYVEDAVAILEWPLLDAPEEVYGAVRAAPYLPK